MLCLHGCVLQGSLFVLLPLQSSPSPEGGGLVHVLCLVRVPPPQVLSQGPGLPQGDQFPSSPEGDHKTDKKRAKRWQQISDSYFCKRNVYEERKEKQTNSSLPFALLGNPYKNLSPIILHTCILEPS